LGATDGEVGNGNEYGGGLNWFLTGTRNQRVVLEGLYYSDSPADNPNTPYIQFASGTAISLEYYVKF